MKHTVFPVPRFPHNFCLTANEKDFSLPLEMTMQERRHSPSFLWKEVARSAGGWLRSLFPSANPLPFGHPPFHGKGVDGFHHFSLLPLEGGGAAREVGFTLFRLRPTPCPSGIPLPGEGGRWVTHPVSPSFLWKEVARSAGGWLHSLSSSANLLPFGHPPSKGRGMV